MQSPSFPPEQWSLERQQAGRAHPLPSGWGDGGRSPRTGWMFPLWGWHSHPCVIRKDPAVQQGKIQARATSSCFALPAFPSFFSPLRVLLILPSIWGEELVHDSMSSPTPWLPQWYRSSWKAPKIVPDLPANRSHLVRATSLPSKDLACLQCCVAVPYSCPGTPLHPGTLVPAVPRAAPHTAPDLAPPRALPCPCPGLCQQLTPRLAPGFG